VIKCVSSDSKTPSSTQRDGVTSFSMTLMEIRRTLDLLSRDIESLNEHLGSYTPPNTANILSASRQLGHTLGVTFTSVYKMTILLSIVDKRLDCLESQMRANNYSNTISHLITHPLKDSGISTLADLEYPTDQTDSTQTDIDWSSKPTKQKRSDLT